MTKIKNMNMADVVMSNNDIDVRTSFFGLVEKAVYLPTQSKMLGKTYDYTLADGDLMKKLIEGSVGEMDDFLRKGGRVSSVAIGNVRAEVCESSDARFAIVQLFRFVDFQYVPISQPLVFEDHDAEVVLSLFAN